MRLARRLLGLALYRLVGAARDRDPVQAAHITYLEQTAALAVYVELDDRGEGVR